MHRSHPNQPNRLGALAVAGVMFLSAGSLNAQLANDLFAQRPQITGNSYSASSSGNTQGAGAANEVNEKMEPAPATQASLWYEWKGPTTGAWIVKATFAAGTGSLAVYALPANGSQMSQLLPAGACLNHVTPSISLKVQKDQRFVVRVWTDKTTPSGFSLNLEIPGPPVPLLEPTPPLGANLSVDYWGGGTEVARMSLRWLTTEEGDARLEEGKWAPATVAAWYAWRVPSGPEKEWQLSTVPQGNPDILYQVLRSHPSQPGRYQPLTAPESSLRFTAVPEENLFVRVSSAVPYHLLDLNRDVSFFIHPPCQGDNHATTPFSLQPGASVQVNGAGATPTEPRLPGSIEAPENFPDVWVRLTGLTPEWPCRLSTSRFGNVPAWPIVYRVLADGGLEPVAAGGSLAFRPEEGMNYVVRLQILAFQPNASRDYLQNLFLNQSPDPVPINDEREGAIKLNAAMMRPVTIDLRGATASARDAVFFDGTPPAAVYKPRSHTIWYALDLPPSAAIHQVSAWSHRSRETVSLFKLNGDGTLTTPPTTAGSDGSCLRYRPDGSRIYAMINGSEDKLLFLVAPVSVAGDRFADALPIEIGETLQVVPGAATMEPGEDLPTETQGTIWLRWTAPATGKFHLSVRGSGDFTWVSVFTGEALRDLIRLEGQSFGIGSIGDDAILTFDAGQGMTFYFQVRGDRSQWAPAMLTLSRADGASPYFYWRQLYPAWDDILDDPNADPDGDGLSNLMEMATGRHPGHRNDPPHYLEILSPPSPAGYKLHPNVFDYGYLTGPSGCRPFKLIKERSRDLQIWQDAGPVTYEVLEVLADDPLPYFRFRVSPEDAP